MLTHHDHLWICSSTPVIYVPLVSSSRKCFLQHLMELHVVTFAHEERDCEVLRVWVLKGLFCQWMMSLNSGHDVSELSPFFTLTYRIFPINFSIFPYHRPNPFLSSPQPLVRKDRITVVPNTQFISVAKVTEDMLIRELSSPLYVLTEFGLIEYKFRTCHID